VTEQGSERSAYEAQTQGNYPEGRTRRKFEIMKNNGTLPEQLRTFVVISG